MQNGSTSDRLARMYSQAKGSREEVEKFGSEAEKTAILAKRRSLKQEIELPLQLAMEKVKEAEGKMREEDSSPLEGESNMCHPERRQDVV